MMEIYIAIILVRIFLGSYIKHFRFIVEILYSLDDSIKPGKIESFRRK